MTRSSVTIRRRFRAVLLFAVGMVVVLGSLSAWWFTRYRTYADDLHDRVLLSTRWLGDLANYTSDYRAAEGALLLGPADAANQHDELAGLEARIDVAAVRYGALAHTETERRRFAQFTGEWQAYRGEVDHIRQNLRQGRRAEALAAYIGASHQRYDRASNSLEALTATNIDAASAVAKRVGNAFAYTRLLTITAMVLASGLVGFGLVWMRRTIADPLLMLAATMNRLARRETDLVVPMRDRRDEIGAMARAVEVFRLNAIELALQQQATERQAALLGDQLAEEQRLTELQRNFLVMASHEFRTPLAIIDGQAQRLASARAEVTREIVAERASVIRATVKRIVNVIDHLLAHARLVDTGAEILFDPVGFDLGDMVEEICQQHRELVAQADILLDRPVQVMPFFGDRRLLAHAIGNLIANAIKFSGPRMMVRVHVHSNDTEAVIVVDDSGPGVPHGEREHIFTRYFRGSGARDLPGSGVGLYLARMVVDLHHGTIAVADAEPAGARFIVRLPHRNDAGIAHSG